ncbi:hypothetical protein [Metabacillus endolithicus]|uniref:Uncharacterized protein n=1 Tax=Metabacillus endolithicus TaxID=1535204 RepID=A0ABW5C0H9_9BACI|nr:hypothetical protein [Metabacillus endolithicus]UPG63995.1 hypothetical protein MVE64_02315 [Metabacillus endolithicus]
MVNIKIGELKIQEVGSTSGVFSGKNLQKNFSHYSKETAGFGTVDGNFNKVGKNIGMSKHDQIIDQGFFTE